MPVNLPVVWAVSTEGHLVELHRGDHGGYEITLLQRSDDGRWTTALWRRRSAGQAVDVYQRVVGCRRRPRILLREQAAEAAKLAAAMFLHPSTGGGE